MILYSKNYFAGDLAADKNDGVHRVVMWNSEKGQQLQSFVEQSSTLHYSLLS